jgi:hypothetical protein
MSNQDHPHQINRRQFIGRVSGAAVGTGVGLALVHKGVTALGAESKLERRNEQSGMIYKPFGKTGLNISRLTFGCIQLTADRLPALEMAVERGVNLVHISNSYTRGQAFTCLGTFLKTPSNRDKVWVALKGINERGLFDNIDDQLRTLNTDHVDIYCNPVNKPDLVRSEQELAKFEALKKAGKVRFLNLTTHGNQQESMETALGVEKYSCILAAIDLSNIAGLKATIQNAGKANVGVMAMKSMRNRNMGGPEKVVPALFAAGVTTVLKSLNTSQDVDAWFDAANKAAKAAADARLDGQVLADCGDCTLCGLCKGCPNGVAIEPIVLNYTYYYQQQRLADVAAERYAEIHPKHTALSCGDCGRCEEICPMGVPVRRIIREAHAALGAMA